MTRRKNAASLPKRLKVDGGGVAIACLQTAAVDASTLHLGQADGPLLQLLPLPYSLRDDI